MKISGKAQAVVDVWKKILLCFSVVVLLCALKNYLIYFSFGTISCEFLCPSVFGRSSYTPPALLSSVFNFQVWLGQSAQQFFNLVVTDKSKLFSALVAAPLVEECMYRGPLFVLKRHLSVAAWWLLAILLSALFALSHGRCGLSLLPLFSLGLSACWLIMKTGKIWPSFMLHFLYNFYFVSFPLYMSLLYGD